MQARIRTAGRLQSNKIIHSFRKIRKIKKLKLDVHCEIQIIRFEPGRFSQIFTCHCKL